MPSKVLEAVTEAIIERSRTSRTLYLQRLEASIGEGVNRKVLGCSNLAHGAASLEGDEKNAMLGDQRLNMAIVTAYNDMLSAHEPYKTYPPLIKRALAQLGVSAQVAGGVPAMCDGITQSQPGMDLSLFSRDTIAMGTAIALSHNMFDGALYLGVCDKIVPGLLIGALSFGHLPAVFVPAGPMPSGISNAEKAKVRQEYTAGKIGRDVLLSTEAASYHAPGTCTFYGTANSNQMLMEIMGLHLPGSSFVPTNTPLRDALTEAAAQRLVGLRRNGDAFMPIGRMLDEKSFVNAIVGLLATGGSTNHTIHLIAMARAAGIILTWEDFDALSHVVPLLCRMYPNGSADVNHFHEAGGMGVVIGELLGAGLLHESVETIMGQGLSRYLQEPQWENGVLSWIPSPEASRNRDVIGSVAAPFDAHGGVRLLRGNLGQSVIKTSALKAHQKVIEAPALTFESQEALEAAFKAGELDRDFIAVVRYQGPAACGMPELHGLMKPMGVLQDRGFKVAIVTDGRMSGASGKVPSAIHMSPEALKGGLIAKVRDGDMIRLDADAGTLELLVDAQTLYTRPETAVDMSAHRHGMGRELFAMMRLTCNGADEGACTFTLPGDEL